jgi:hypothetical protein
MSINNRMAGQSFSIQYIQNIVKNADTGGQPGPADGPEPDGHLTLAEIKARLQVLQQPPAPNVRIDMAQRQQEINALNFLDKNFAQIAGPDLHQEVIFGPMQPPPVKSIMAKELTAFAAKDGDPRQLSTSDLNAQSPATPPTPPKPPMQPPSGNAEILAIIRNIQQQFALLAKLLGGGNATV